MMDKTFTILKHEFIQSVKRKSFIIITLSLPLIALLGMLIYQVIQNVDTGPGETEEQRIGYVDSTGIFSNYTEESPNLIFISYPDEESAREDLLAGEIEEYITIYPDYLATGQVVRYITKSELEIPSSTIEHLSRFLQSNLLADKVSGELLERIEEPMSLTSLRLDENGEISETPDPMIVMLVPYVFGLLFMISIFFTSGYLLQSVAEEKENRIIEVLLSSVSSHQLLLGKILGLGAAGLVQIVIWLITLRIFADVASVNIPALSDLAIPVGMLIFGVIYFLLGYLLFAVGFAGLGSIGSTARESQQLSGIFILPAVVPLWLLAIIGENPDGVVAKVLTFIPFTAPTTVVMRLPNTDIPAWELALSLIIMVGTITFGIWFVAKVFRVYLLLYGKRPAFREILRYVREG